MAKDNVTGKEPTMAQLKAQLKELAKAQDVMVKAAEKQHAEDRKRIDDLEKAASAAKEQRKEKAAISKLGMLERINAAPHRWVQVYHKGLKEGIDFAFNFEGKQVKLFSGKPVFLSELIINHLKACRRPVTKEDQGEAGGSPTVRKELFENFTIVPCSPPEKKRAPTPVEEPAAV